ncbi:MAG TPA: ASPIC/UnbV domain-containing protein, partial [Candidatus Saccharimonadales bacterium]|nr:ASPIC/UnbV domain-containing protein [Candidatus Saccharimonadales bacterium]
RGDGRRGFTPITGPASGLEVYNEQRGAAVTDFDHDGRTDLLVTQNGAATRLFRNTSARPGLRVRLSGPPGNPDGIGAVVRLKFSAGWGPAREVHGGGGYWSQDSDSPVLATPEQPSAILVVWPGGRRTEQSLPQIMNEVTIAY